MKTAISIPDKIFQEVEKYAKKHGCSRSEVFSIAVIHFLEKVKSRNLIETLNRIYEKDESIDDKRLREKAVKHYRKKILKEPY